MKYIKTVSLKKPTVLTTMPKLHSLCAVFRFAELCKLTHPFSLTAQIGTNQMAVCAKAQNKPFYVVAESFKFVRLFPLNQQDVPDKFKVSFMYLTGIFGSTLKP